MNLSECNEKPIINYPTFWDYKVIFESQVDVQAIFKNILNEREFKYEFSHNSSNNKYQSYLLTIFVNSEADRLNIFNQLKDKAKFVL